MNMTAFQKFFVFFTVGVDKDLGNFINLKYATQINEPWYKNLIISLGVLNYFNCPPLV